MRGRCLVVTVYGGLLTASSLMRAFPSNFQSSSKGH